MVCDNSNHRLQVLSKEGRFVRCIGAGELESPQGVCYHAGELLVADLIEDCVVVVNPVSGKILRRFGKKGRLDGEFMSPLGVAMLQGQLFVSENVVNHIQSFE